MTRITPPKEINTRLNRELRHMRFGGWKAIVGVITLFGIVILAFVKVPSDTQFLTGQVTGVMSHMSESGPFQQIGVIVNGQHRSAGTRARLLHPSKGEVICLRQTTYWPLGQQTLSMTSLRFCNGTIATSGVD